MQMQHYVLSPNRECDFVTAENMEHVIAKFAHNARLKIVCLQRKRQILAQRNLLSKLVERAIPLSFATFAVPVTPPPILTPVAVQLSPQAYPLGQHPPPPSEAQRNQPRAQPSSPNLVGSAGATATETPLLLRTSELAGAGHDVEEQSLPIRQQPPR